MKKITTILCSFFVVLSCSSIVCAWISVGVIAGNQAGGTSCSSYVNVIDYQGATSTGNQALSSDAWGQSFSLGSGINLHSIEVYAGYAGAGPNELTIRIGTTKDLSSYLAECVIADGSNGVWELCNMSGTAPSLSSSTTYYLGVIEGSGDYRWRYSYDAGDNYADGVTVDPSTVWQLGSDNGAGRDQWFKINRCD